MGVDWDYSKEGGGKKFKDRYVLGEGIPNFTSNGKGISLYNYEKYGSLINLSVPKGLALPRINGLIYRLVLERVR
ncbi:MAG: hypothetical protein WC503_00935 [Candidatus Shapirobacteria bacterium]